MLRNKIRWSMVAGSLVFAAIFMSQASASRAADPDPKAAQARNPAREHWERVVTWYMEEETAESSLRIRDQDVHERGWFKFMELWQFSPKEGRWIQLKADKFEKPIVLPNQKGKDEPPDSQTLVELREMEPKTAGLWFAKWVADDVPCSTYMKVGGARAKNTVEGKSKPGMVRTVVPIDLDHSENMDIPDPRIYCIPGGPGKPGAAEQGGK